MSVKEKLPSGVRARAAHALRALCVAFLIASSALAGGTGPVTGLALPRFVSLNASEINVRRGPGLEYRRDWIYRRRGLPVRVLDEFENWRLIEDSTGAGGWVFHALISGRRMAEVTAEGVLLLRRPGEGPHTGACEKLLERAPAARGCAERGVVARLLACQPDWCRISASDRTGWVPKQAIWGAGPDEVFGK